MRNIKVDSVRYQRNGSAGEGFFAVSFRFRQGRVWSPMLAVLRTGDGDDEAFDEARVYVVNPAAPTDCFDGPYFAPALIEACERSRADGTAFGGKVQQAA